ncbi:MAG: ABC transporter substrate-binding protein, partial [Oscillospiraceae bacterium]
LSLSACGAGKPADTSPSASAAANSATVTVTDHNGNSVTVPKDAKRIVVCDIYPLPSVLSVFFDSADRIVGMPDVSMSAAQNGLLGQLYPEILNAQTGFIKGTEVNTEELMKLKPDVVFYSAESPRLGEQLTQAGFAAVAISASKWDYNCVETLKQWIALLSRIFPENDKTKTVQEYSEKVLKQISDKTSTLADSEKKRAFFLFKYDDSTIMTSGERFFGNWWAETTGAVNVSKELPNENAAAVTMEQIYQWNPDVIFITNFTKAQPDDLYNNTIGANDWSAISAVQKKQVYKMPLGMYRSYTPGADTPVTLLWMAKTLYPELFSDVDITKETVDYYKAVFGVTLTDEQANAIFAPASSAANGF